MLSDLKLKLYKEKIALEYRKNNRVCTRFSLPNSLSLLILVEFSIIEISKYSMSVFLYLSALLGSLYHLSKVLD